MAIRQGRVVALAPGLAAAAQQLVEQLRGLGVQADLAAAADQPGLTIWVAAAADQTRLACLMQTLAARCPGAVQWVAAADADLLALQALALAQEVLALPVEAGELAWRWQRHGVPAAAPAVPELLPGIVGNSAPLVAALAVLGRFAACDAGVLVLGETGTGKELFAQALHRLSARGAKPFVALNCAAMPADLIESELFGHTRGAFTSAAAARSGLIHEAEGGTLFLDDIDGLPAAAQAKLLRFLQEHEYRVVGGNTVQRANVRVVAASNRPLGQMVKLGQFRADLFYRLNILTLSLPPLRQRLDDLAALAAYTLGPDKALSAATLARLRQHAWPGNVRELGHVLARAGAVRRPLDRARAPAAGRRRADAGARGARLWRLFAAGQAAVRAGFDRQPAAQPRGQCDAGGCGGQEGPPRLHRADAQARHRIGGVPGCGVKRGGVTLPSQCDGLSTAHRVLRGAAAL